MTGKVLENITEIKAWGGYRLIPQIDEKAEDIWFLVTYRDHGDDYVVVGTNDRKFYEYGYWLNRDRFNPDGVNWVRRPMTYKKEDTYSKLSNDIYHEFHYEFRERGWNSDRSKIYSSTYDAQLTFNHFLNYMKAKMEGDTMYLQYGNIHKQELRMWLKLNGIDTADNLEALENTPFDTHINGFDGVAGKREIPPDLTLYADSFSKIVVNGKKLDRRKVSKPSHDDEWGITTYSMRLNRFHKTQDKKGA